MGKDETPNGFGLKASTSISPQNKQEMKIADNFVTGCAEEMEHLECNINEKRGISLWLDSKVSNHSWRWYHPVNLTASNREEIIKVIKSYQKFYKKVSTTLKKIYNEEAKSKEEKQVLQTEIDALRKKLQDMLNKARLLEKLTSSSTEQRLHQKFIAENEKLECLIKGMQIVSLKQDLEAANGIIDDLEQQMESINAKYNGLSERVSNMQDERNQLVTELREQEQRLAEVRREHVQRLAEQDLRLSEVTREQDQRMAEVITEQDQRMAKLMTEHEQRLAEVRREHDQRLAEQARKQDEQRKDDGRKFDKKQACMQEQISSLIKKYESMEEKQAKMEADKDRLEKENAFLLSLTRQ